MAGSFCGKCGAEITDPTDAFCRKCGSPLANADMGISQPGQRGAWSTLSGTRWLVIAVPAVILLMIGGIGGMALSLGATHSSILGPFSEGTATATVTPEPTAPQTAAMATSTLTATPAPSQIPTATATVVPRTTSTETVPSPVPPKPVATTPVSYAPVMINGAQAHDASLPLVWKNGQICQDPTQGGTNCYTLAGGVLVKAGDRNYRWLGGTDFVDAGPSAAPTRVPAQVAAPAPPTSPCAQWFTDRRDLGVGNTVTWNWNASKGQRLLVSANVWGTTTDIAIRLWTQGGTLLNDVQINGSGTAELVAPFDGPLHWDIRNSIWNAPETVELSVQTCSR